MVADKDFDYWHPSPPWLFALAIVFSPVEGRFLFSGAADSTFDPFIREIPSQGVVTWKCRYHATQRAVVYQGDHLPVQSDGPRLKEASACSWPRRVAADHMALLGC